MKVPVPLITMMVLGIFFQVGCSSGQDIERALPPSVIKEIQNLSTHQNKSAFLHQLWQEDQDLRINSKESEVITKYGYNSSEHQAYTRKFVAQNLQIFLKLKTYVKSHGYPQVSKVPDTYHALAINAFPTIIGHHYLFEDQQELLIYVYEGYKSNDCPIEDVVHILGEMYENKHQGQQYELESKTFTPEQEFKELVDYFGLDFELN